MADLCNPPTGRYRLQALLWLLPLWLVCSGVSSAWAASGAPRMLVSDRYQVEGYQLANGLQVLLKPGMERGHVAIRLVVGVGFDDFNCAEQELPHLLEHLLFSGLDGTGEGGLEERMQALGGEWNAFTSNSDTTFVIEAPARNQRKVLDLLRDILTKTHIDAQAFELSRRIVEHEDGGHYSHLQRLLDRQDIGHGAADHLATELGLKCAEPSNLAELTLAQVQAVRTRWYGANNMTLIIVGDLDRLLPAYLERVYGQLPALEPEDQQQPLLGISHAARAQRTLTTGWLGDGAKLHWYFLEPAEQEDPPQALDLLQTYLDWALYTHLRLEQGLSYGPWSQRDAFGDTGMLSLNADLDRGDVDKANTLLAQWVEELRERGLDPAAFERLKQQAVARQAWATQGSTALADYYWTHLGDYDGGRFSDPAQPLREVTLEQVNRAMRALFAGPAYVRVEKPLLGYDDALALSWALPALAIVLLAGWAWRRRSRTRR
jgi:predicted Zn-dependent peptidase